jgi:hypothetical protein
MDVRLRLLNNQADWTVLPSRGQAHTTNLPSGPAIRKPGKQSYKEAQNGKDS